jgi:endonuclease YncB( thermonuclease family)
MGKKRELILLIIAIVVLLALNYSSLDSFVIKKVTGLEYVEVERVIDGDTVVVNGSSMRLLGINTPEKGEWLYGEARDYMAILVINKTIGIEGHGKDRYYRELVYLYEKESNENINLKMIENGYANYYFPEGRDEHYDDFVRAWKDCIDKNINLCEKSSDKCSECIKLTKFGYDEEAVLYNSCGFDCNITGWSIKDEGRKKFVFKGFILKSYNEVSVSAKDFGEEYVWTDTGDTLFLRDAKNKLVLWEGY